jgi:hypothetical protein
MPRTLSSAARTAIYAQQTGEVFLYLATIAHVDITPTLRFVNNTVSITSRGNVYEAWPFELTLPEEREDQMTQVQMAIDNIDRRIMEGLRLLTSAPSMTLEVVLASAPDTVEAGPFPFALRGVEYTALMINGTLSWEDTITEPAMQYEFSPRYFPGLFP